MERTSTTGLARAPDALPDIATGRQAAHITASIVG
jgi:hypothetical protein